MNIITAILPPKLNNQNTTLEEKIKENKGRRKSSTLARLIISIYMFHDFKLFLSERRIREILRVVMDRAWADPGPFWLGWAGLDGL